MRMGVTERVRVGMAVFVGVHKAAVPMLVDLLMHVFVGVWLCAWSFSWPLPIASSGLNHLYVRQNGRPPIPQRCLLRLPQQNLGHSRGLDE